ncbi:LysR family transcriptional regulator [Halobacteriovorax sp. JY17]|uniref:LysR family transcriptional regulator n=1 Tax=Halobacteriovorax sp. JY17 TaxID=2014617 RepID=UPI000C5A16A8|nr:LysR family transcriptional regulator [Halobacteriovorax sp. JY17]PIK13730.1 MAG: LysR family transcriptional regulator [Halobacteriovorax sp. JY17]
MLPSSNDIQYFLEVSKTLNLSRSAERLGVTQPTLTLAIKRLESSLGVTLLIRSKNGVSLTRHGESFQRESKKFLEEWYELKSKVIKEKDDIRGIYSIGVHPSVALYTLGSFIPDLYTTYPHLEVNLTHSSSRIITEQVISHQLDMGIVVNPVSHPDLVIIKLISDEVTLWEIEGNKNRDVLLCDPDLTQTSTLMQKIKKQKFSFKRIIHSGNLEVLTNLVESGAGIGILPGKVVTASRGDLKTIKDAPIFKDNICLVYRCDRVKTKASELLISEIKKLKK